MTRTLPRYGMFSYDGDRAVHRIVERAKREIADPDIRLAEVHKNLRQRMTKIESRHSEVFDTDVRDHIYNAVRPTLVHVYGATWLHLRGGREIYSL